MKFGAVVLLAASLIASHVGASESIALRGIGAPPAFAPACAHLPWLCAFKHSALPSDPLAVLNAVNRSVNGSIRPVAEVGSADVWRLPTDGTGDCEDYALAKMIRLRGLFPVAMTVVRNRGENHAVLMVRVGTDDFILDNLTNSIKAWNATGYTLLARQDFDHPTHWQVIGE